MASYEPRPCPVCGTVFTPVRKTKEVCSKPCRAKRAWTKKIAEQPRLKNYRKAAAERLVPLSPDERQLILGSMLGDGSVASHKGHYWLRFCHGSPQLDYLLWKQSVLARLMPAEPKCYSNTLRGKQYLQYHIHSIQHPEITAIRHLCYTDGTKRVTQKWLDEINELGLAVWYMDDGTFLQAANARQIVFCTESFLPEEVTILRLWLENRWAVPTALQPITTSEGARSRIRINRTSVSKFAAIVQPYIHPIMRYKLPQDDLPC